MKNTQLVIKESTANNITCGNIVKLGNSFREDCGVVITKTEHILTVLVDKGCYDFTILKGR